MKSKKTKNKKLSIRVSEDLYNQIQENAQKEKQSLSSYIENCINTPSIDSIERKHRLCNALIGLQDSINSDEYNSIEEMKNTLKKEMQNVWQSLS